MKIIPNKEEQWKGLRDKTRNMIRKHEGAGNWISDAPGLLGTFYKMYRERMLSKDAPYMTFAALRSLLDNMVLYSELTSTHSYIGGAIVQFNEKSAKWRVGAVTSEFLLWHIINVCRDKKIESISFGKSQEGSGSFRFKKHFAGKYVVIRESK